MNTSNKTRTRRTLFKFANKTMRASRVESYQNEHGHPTLFAVLDNGERHAIKAGGYMLDGSSLKEAIKNHVGDSSKPPLYVFNDCTVTIKSKPSCNSGDAMNHKTRAAWRKVIYALMVELGIDPHERGAVNKALSFPSFNKDDGAYIISEAGFYNLVREINEHNEVR